MPNILLDIAHPAYENPIALGAAVGFFMVCMAISVVVFIVLRKKVKAGSRLIVASILLLVAVVGSIIVMFAVGLVAGSPSPRPAATTTLSRRVFISDPDSYSESKSVCKAVSSKFRILRR